MKKIKLTQGQVALVDDEDFERVNAFKWYAHWSERTQSYYATRKTKRPNQKHIYMHRFIMRTPKHKLCDHVDGNTLDNRKSNLRNCTRSQNQMNKGAQSNNKLGIKGVSWSAWRKRFIAQLSVKGKRVFYKSFRKIDQAILAYAEASKKHHGEFRRKKTED